MTTRLRLAPPDVVEFIYNEARLLDDRHFEDWLALLTEDFYLWAPERIGQEESTRSQNVSLFNDDQEILEMRIARLRHPAVHSQLPPSQANRIVSNILVEDAAEGASEVVVHSTFLMGEARLGEQRVFAGHYEHRLRREGGEWRIAKKVVRLINADSVFSNIALPF